MIVWIGIVVICVLATLPCLLALRAASARGRRAPALALHRAQLAVLDHEASLGLIAQDEREAARLEVQRRLLAEADRAEADCAEAMGRVTRDSGALLLGGVFTLPLLTLGLYALVGHPQLPAMPMAQRRAAAAAAQGAALRDAALIDTLRDHLQGLDPHTAQARQGYDLLARAEAARGHWREAASAWRLLLRGGFDATVAAEAAEAQTIADGRVSADSAALFRQAVAAAPPDAPWRLHAEQRIAEGEHDAAAR